MRRERDAVRGVPFHAPFTRDCVKTPRPRSSRDNEPRDLGYYGFHTNSRAWVSLVISPLQTVGRQVGVDLRRDQMRMAKQFLNAAQIGAGIENMSGVAVP